jgi:hypothetical protein
MLKKSSPLKQLGQMEPNLEGSIFYNISQSEKRIYLGGHVCWPNGTKLKKLYRGSCIDASCQVWLHFAQQFQRRRFF